MNYYELLKDLQDYKTSLNNLKTKKQEEQKGAFDKGMIWGLDLGVHFFSYMIQKVKELIKIEEDAIAYELEQKEKNKNEKK